MSGPSRMFWFKLWRGRMCEDTAHLSSAALGLYMRLLMEQTRRLAPVPDTPAMLRRLHPDDDPEKALAELGDLVERRGGHISMPYAVEQIAKFETRSERNRRNIAKRWDVVDGGIEDAEVGP